MSRTISYCTADDCKYIAKYDYPDEEIPKFCDSHKSIGMAYFNKRRCHYLDDEYKQCTTEASYGITKPIYCFKHKKENMINTKKGQCNIENCHKRAFFNHLGEKSGIKCYLHKDDGMINIWDKKCEIDGCKIKPSFNLPDERKGLRCKKHKTDEMVNVIDAKCDEEDCKISPSYNYEGNKKGLYCVTHKKDGMVNVVSKRCIYENCKIAPHFNYINENTGLYCAKHKKENMINISSTKCAFDGCMIEPPFNFKGEKKGLYCVKHKLDGMINVVSKRCAEDECDTLPVYNYKECKTGLYCLKHKKDEMIDVTKKNCIENDCNKRACYNYETENSGIYCSKHKKENMIDFSHRRCKECNKIAIYNYEYCTVADYCSNHKKKNMIDIFNKNKRCKSELCTTYATSKKYRGYCLYCFVNLFPDEKVSKNYKTKEKAVTDFIKETYINYNIICDKTIKNGCSKRRPDILIDLNTHVIIIEIDEEQHNLYDDTCENKRIMEISQDLGHPNIVFIRFNPDAYTDKNNKRITSCWSISSNGISIVPKNKKKRWIDRLTALKSIIDKWIINIPEKHITIEKIFYDGY